MNAATARTDTQGRGGPRGVSIRGAYARPLVSVAATRAAAPPWPRVTPTEVDWQPVERATVDLARLALAAGVGAVWTGRLVGTVDLGRLDGPHEGLVPLEIARRSALPGLPPWRLCQRQIRSALYAWALTEGTQFDVYRWVNLPDLADVWRLLTLPDGVRAEWRRVLIIVGLLASNDDQVRHGSG